MYLRKSYNRFIIEKARLEFVEFSPRLFANANSSNYISSYRSINPSLFKVHMLQTKI